VTWMYTTDEPIDVFLHYGLRILFGLAVLGLIVGLFMLATGRT